MKMDFESWEKKYGPVVEEQAPEEPVFDTIASVVENDKIVDKIEIPKFEVKFDIEYSPDNFLDNFKKQLDDFIGDLNLLLEDDQEEQIEEDQANDEE